MGKEEDGWAVIMGAAAGRPSSPAASLTGLQQHQGVQPVVGHHHQLLLSQVSNNIKESNLWSAIITSCFSHRLATTSRSPTCGRPSSPAASLTEEEVSSILAIS